MRPGGLRIGIDVAGAGFPETGIGRYTVFLTRTLAEVAPAAELVLFFNSARGRFPPALRDVAGRRVNPRIPARVLRGLWRRFGWPPVEAFTGPLDILHSSDWIHPPQRHGKSITTVHDLGPLDHPEWYSPDIVEIHEEKNRQAASSAQGIIAVSEFTRGRFLHWFPEVDPARVHVVGHGVSTDFSVAPPAHVGSVLRHHGLSAPYLLYVGTREKRKNLMGLIEIFRRVAVECRRVQLALVGMRPWMEGRDIHGVGKWVGLELEEEVKRWGLESRVKVLGTLSRCELVSVYSGAAALLFPSLYEGFGFPALEAMACGAPVVASSRTAIPEVVGDAGLLADPEDADAFAEMTLRLLDDPELSGDLRSRGLERARRFSWTATGRETLTVYESILQGATF